MYASSINNQRITTLFFKGTRKFDNLNIYEVVGFICKVCIVAMEKIIALAIGMIGGKWPKRPICLQSRARNVPIYTPVYIRDVGCNDTSMS